MIEAFDAMSFHPFLTLFLGLFILAIVHEITGIFKKCDCDKNDRDE